MTTICAVAETSIGFNQFEMLFKCIKKAQEFVTISHQIVI